MSSTRGDRHAPVRGGSTDRASSNTAAGGRGNSSVPRSQTNYGNPIFPRHPSSGDGGDRHGPGDNYEVRSSSTSRSVSELSDLGRRFAREVDLNDHRGCRDFIEDHAAVVNEQDYERKYLEEAVQALQDGDRTLSLSYVEKCATLKCVREYARLKKGRFLEALVAKTREAVEDHNAVVKEFKSRRDALVSKRSTQESTATGRHSSTTGQLDLTTTNLANMSLSTSPGSYSTEKEPSKVVGRHSADPKAQPTKASAFLDSVAEDDEQNSNSAPVVQGDPRFIQFDPRHWKEVFKIGCVFATKTFAEDTRILQPQDPVADHYSEERIRARDGTIVVGKLRRWVVVAERHGFCLTVPIYTYGGRGLLKKGLSKSNIRAHARIYMDGATPTWLEDEPRSAKRDIVVTPQGNQRLERSSRICFERTTSNDYNNKFMKIGTVTKASIPYLLEYWVHEHSRVTGHERGT